MTQANPATTPISPSKSAALSRVLDLVTKGYTRYVAGTCPAHKAVALARKFHEKYGIGCSPAQRITRRQKGLANVALVIYWPGDGAPTARASVSIDAPHPAPDTASLPAPDPAPFFASAAAHDVAWLLLVTAGAGSVTEQEALSSVLEGVRLHWLGYELLRLPKRGGVSWTWRRPKAAMADWYALLGDQLARRKMQAAADTLRRIAQQPGFAGVRQQSWELVLFARSRGYTGEMPFLFHMQKVGHGVPLRLT